MATLFVRDSYIQPHSLHFHADNLYDKYTYTPLDESKRGQWSIADDVLTMTNEDGTTYTYQYHIRGNILTLSRSEGGRILARRYTRVI